MFTNDKSFILLGTQIEYLTAFLNSKVFKFTYKDYFPELLGETYELRKIFFESIAVKPSLNDNHYKDVIQKLYRRAENNLPFKHLIKQLDEMIFDHYEINEEDRKIIEGSLEKKLSDSSNIFASISVIS